MGDVTGLYGVSVPTQGSLYEGGRRAGGRAVGRPRAAGCEGGGRAAGQGCAAPGSRKRQGTPEGTARPPGVLPLGGALPARSPSVSVAISDGPVLWHRGRSSLASSVESVSSRAVPGTSARCPPWSAVLLGPVLPPASALPLLGGPHAEPSPRVVPWARGQGRVRVL